MVSITERFASIKGETAPLPALPVALYFHRFGTVGGGAQHNICLLANALCERGFHVHMVTWDGPDAVAFHTLDPRIVWSRLGFRHGAADKLRRTRVLADLLRDHRIRILVGFVMSGDKTVYAAAKLAGVRLIVAERNAPTMYRLRYSFAQRWLSFRMLHLADRITVQMPDFVVGYPASLRERIEVIPNPVPVAERSARPNRPVTDGRFNLLAVGLHSGVIHVPRNVNRLSCYHRELRERQTHRKAAPGWQRHEPACGDRQRHDGAA